MGRTKRKTGLTKQEALKMDSIIKEIFHMDEEGFACGLTVCGDLFVGSVHALYARQTFWTHDSPANREFVEVLWGMDSMAKEVK